MRIHAYHAGSVPSEFFVSYSRNEIAAANALRAVLEPAGFDVSKGDVTIRGGELAGDLLRINTGGDIADRQRWHAECASTHRIVRRKTGRVGQWCFRQGATKSFYKTAKALALMRLPREVLAGFCRSENDLTY